MRSAVESFLTVEVAVCLLCNLDTITIFSVQRRKTYSGEVNDLSMCHYVFSMELKCLPVSHTAECSLIPAV